MNYNLLEERWIPVLWTNGEVGRVGILEALTKAGSIREIAASNPMDRVAILRFLLALLYWCKGNPPENPHTIPNDSFPASWFTRLDEHREYFNLLGDGKRFYQDNAAQRTRAATDLLQEIPTGNNFWHFRHSTDGENGLCPSCCALGLLRLPLFSVSGLPDLKSGINGAPPIYIVPWGKSLLETLKANWIPHRNIGDPVWVQTGSPLTPGQDVPLLTGLTLLARRVWLHTPSTPAARCVSCGTSEIALIRTCEFQTAGKQENDRWDDPHVTYLDRTPRKAAKAPDLTATGKFSMDRPWPNLLSSILKSERFAGKTILIVALATDQAKNIDVWERMVTLVLQASDQSTQISEQIERWRKKDKRMSEQIVEIVQSKVTGAVAVTPIRPHVESIVSGRVSEILGNPAEAWDDAVNEYRPMMAIIAHALSPGYTTAAVRRRKALADITPEMHPKATDKKTNRKKGGNT